MSRQPPVFTRTDTLCLYTTRFLSESFGAWTMGDDAAMLAVVTTANVACGFHAGDWTVMQQTVDEAVKNGVSIDAHPSYPDLQGFGRRPMTMSNRSEEHTSELQSLMRISYAVFCLKKNKKNTK